MTPKFITSTTVTFPLLEVLRFQERQDVRWPPARACLFNPGFGIAGYLIEKSAVRRSISTFGKLFFVPND
jgi:hypothetical protein